MKIGIGIGIPHSKVIGSSAPAYEGLLDLYPNAAAAYSPRLLRAAYAGKSCRVRRSGDNSEFDFGFDGSGNLDTTAIVAFCVAGGGTQNGFVVTWYDQSGNSNDVTNATGAQQLPIVSGGVLLTESGLPYFGLNNDSLSKTLSSTISQPATIFVIGKNNPGGAVVGSIFSTNNDYVNNVEIGTRTDINRTVVFDGSVASVNALSIDPTLQTSYYALINGASSAIDVNGTTGTGTVNSTLDKIIIGTGINWGGAIGYVQEVIIYPSNQSANKADIIDNQRTYFNF